MIRCSANARGKDDVSSHRCVRQMGHAGLHRYFIPGVANQRQVQEFPDSKAWFPTYDLHVDPDSVMLP